MIITSPLFLLITSETQEKPVRDAGFIFRRIAGDEIDCMRDCCAGGRTMQPETLHQESVISIDGTDNSAQPKLQQRVFHEIERCVGRQNYDHWFKNKTSLLIQNEDLTIGVASPFLLTWIQKQFRKPLSEAAQSVLGPSARLHFHVDVQSAKTSSATPMMMESKSATAKLHQQKARNNTYPAKRRFADLVEFVVGPSNELAMTATKQVLEQPGQKWNPLYIHGGVGTGKTHLLEGIYREIRRQYPTLQVMYLTSENFANYFTQALRQHTLPSFRQKFRNVDVLLVDDIDFLNSKKVIQEEFLHTFKQLESHGRQMIITADRHPRLLTRLSDDLATRFLSGLVCRIEAPDLETRLQIVERKVARMNIEMTKDAIKYVAQRFKNNVREIEGALNCLETYYMLKQTRIRLTLARQVLADLERDCIRIVRMADIEKAVCNFFGLEPVELKSSKRQQNISQPRMLAMFLSRKLTQAAYSEIGEYFGGRNHSTVVSAERKVENWLSHADCIRVSTQQWSVEDVLQTLEQQLQVG